MEGRAEKQGTQGSADRVTTIRLPDELVQQAAKELGIRNIERIPREIPVHAVSPEAGRKLNLGSGAGSAIANVLIIA